MLEFNVDYAKLGPVENGDIISMGSDKEYNAVFHLAKVPNFEGTDYTECVHLRLQTPGNSKSVYDQPVRLESHPDRPSDPERFPRQWAEYHRGSRGDLIGTPITDLETITPSDARRFELLGITTIEQLASVSDGNLAEIGMGAMALREKAKAHLAGELSPSLMKAKLTKMEAVIEMLMAERSGVLELTDVVETPKAKEKARA
jgi:hypothetical protein